MEVILGLVLLVAGAALVTRHQESAKASSELRRFVRECKQVPISEVTGGYVAISGVVADCSELSDAPISGVESCGHRVVIEQKRLSSRGQAKMLRTVLDHTRVAPFSIVDEDGKAVIDTNACLLLLSTTEKGSAARKEDLPKEVNELLEEHGKQLDDYFGVDARWSEAVLKIGSRVRVYGYADRVLNPASEVSYRESPLGIQIRSQESKPVIITNLKPNEVEKDSGFRLAKQGQKLG